MDDKRLWVTAYHLPDHQLMVTNRPPETEPLIFTLDFHAGAQRATQADLDAARKAGAVTRFYSIPDPF